VSFREQMPVKSVSKVSVSKKQLQLATDKSCH